MARPILFAHGASARERYDGVVANLFEVENERDFELFKKQCITYVKAGNLLKLQELISKWKKTKQRVSMDFRDPESGDTPIMMAVLQNDKQMLQLLLDQDVDLTLRNRKRKTAVQIANEGLQTILLSGKLHTDLKHAAWLGNVSAVKTMLKKKQNINERNIEGMTPLLLATRDINFLENLPQLRDYEPLKVVKTLLEHNADISLYDFDGKTVMHHLVENTGWTARGVTKALLCKAKRIDTVDRKETTPLHTAAKLGDVKIVEMLLQGGSSVSSKSSDGKTPLHYSVISGKEKVTRLLVKWNADVYATDDKGKTPWDLAKEQKNKKLLDVLRQSGCEGSDSSENSDEGDDNRECDPKSSSIAPSSSVNSAEVKAFLPSLAAPLQPIVTKANRGLLTVDNKASIEPQPIKRNLIHEYHARRSKYSPTPLSHRANSAKKTASLPSSFKFEDTTESYFGDNYACISETTSPVETPIGRSDSLDRMQPERLAKSLDSDLDRNEDASMENPRSQISSVSGKSGIGRKASFLCLREDLSKNILKQAPIDNGSRRNDIEAVDVEPRLSSYERTKDVVTQSEYYQEKSYNYGPYCSNREQRKDTQKGRSSFEKRLRSASSANSSLLSSNGKARRLLPELKDAVGEVKDSLGSSFGEYGQRSETDASLPGLQKINLELGMHSPLIKSHESRRPSSSVSCSSSPRISFSQSIESQEGRLKVQNMNSGHVTGGSDVYSTLNRESVKVLYEKLAKSEHAEGCTEVKISVQVSSDDEQEHLSRPIIKIPKMEKEELPYDSAVPRGLGGVGATPEYNEIPSLYSQGRIHSLRNSSDHLYASSAKLHQMHAEAPFDKLDKGTTKLKEASVVHVSLPQIKRAILRQSSTKQPPRKGELKNYPRQKTGKRKFKMGQISNLQLKEFEEKKNALVGIADSSPGSIAVQIPPIINASTKEYANPRLPQEGNDLPTRCSDSPPSPIHTVNGMNIDENFPPLQPVLKRHIQTQLSVVQESSYENGLDSSYNEHNVKDPKIDMSLSVESSADSSLNSSVTIPMGSTTTSEKDYDLGDRDSVRLAEDLKKIIFEKEIERRESTEDFVETAGFSPGISDNYFRELTDIAFAPGINSAISNVPSQRISRRSSLVGSSIGTQTSFDGSDCCEDELHDWKKGAVIDKGAYGTVYRGMTNRGKLVAVKEVELDKIDERKAEITYRKLQEEIGMLKSLTHRFIVKFIGTIMQDNVVDIFMEYIPGGSLALALKQFGPFLEKVFRRFTRQILSAVFYIHQNNIVHRDIKGANIMLTSGGVVKLIDFGCAKQMKQSLTSNSDLLRSCEGTPYWMAPEIIRGIAYGAESDVWSVGCTVFEMATGNPPWTGCRLAAMYAIGCKQSPIPELPCQFSQDARDFVGRCLIRDQNQRATAKQLMKHRFIKGQRSDKQKS